MSFSLSSQLPAQKRYRLERDGEASRSGNFGAIGGGAHAAAG